MCVKQAKRLAIYLVGLMILTCGHRLFVQAGLGAGAFDSLCVGVSQYNSISAGTWVTIGSFILMLVSAALEKRRPDWWVMLSSFVFGIFFDMWGAVFSATLPSELTLIQQILLYIVGLMLAPLGTAVYFTTNISKSAYDEIITALHNALRWPVWVSKNATEATMLILSLLVRGPVGVTTVVTAFAFGPVLQKYMELLDKKKFKILQWEKF